MLSHIYTFLVYVTVLVPLDEVHEESSRTTGQFQTRRIAHHYGIFADLFDSADFLDVVPMTICYDCPDGESVVPVYTGNVISPTEVSFCVHNCASSTCIVLK